jgi:folate-dependent phosphoribosylglycinamide formyltransferase PurN
MTDLHSLKIAREPALRTVLICHADALLDLEGLSLWLGSFSELTGLIVLQGTNRQAWGRIRREMRRVGLLRFLDVLAFRAYYKLVLERGDRQWEIRRLAEMREQYPPLSKRTPIIYARSPNSPEVQAFLRVAAPDLMIARCKMLLKPEVFGIPRLGTFVMHPGVCPEYRNAHGCFWALARNDLKNVGMTLLKIDAGVDTGPVFGDIRSPFDEQNDSHIVIQQRMVFDNLEDLQDLLLDVSEGRARVLSTAGRPSQVWGHPWLTEYFKWRVAAWQRRRNADCAHLS